MLHSQTHQNMQMSLTISPSKAPHKFPSHQPISVSSPSPRIQRVSLQTHAGPLNSLKGSGYTPAISRAIEEEEYRLARSQVVRKGLDLEGYAIEGISIGGQETCIIIPEFKCAFDIGRCPSRAIQQNFVFITHAHLDHIGGLPMYVASRGLYNLKPPTVFVPPCIKEDVENLFDIHRTMGQVELKFDLVPLDVGETYEMRNNLVVRPFRTQHVIPSQGYVIYSVRKKLKKQYIHLKGKQIEKLKKSGVEITDIILSPEVAFTGDTTSDYMVDPRNADALRAKILITEATFLDEGFSIEHARQHGHTHLYEIIENAQWIRNKAVLQLREPVVDLLHDLSTKAEGIIVIHDSMTSSAVRDVSSIKNAESYIFRAITAFSIFCFVSLNLGNKFLQIPKEAEIVNSDNPIEIPSTEGDFSVETANFIAHQKQFMKSSAGDLYNGCRLIDGVFLDHLVKIQKNNQKVWSVGPLHQYAKTENGIGNSINGRDKCLEWLDKQEPDSVLYISFGTTIYMADHDRQLKELATGLELSETKFIWVFRSDADYDKKEEILPQGFEERVKGVGMVVRDWAPQLEILDHPSTGGFLSHCGWNSTLESISYGVPVAAWPIAVDQPMNALFITEVLKTGVNIKEWARRDQVVSSSEISKAVRRLMGSEEGDKLRKRAKELGAKVRSATDDGGVSRLECDSFIAHITR